MSTYIMTAGGPGVSTTTVGLYTYQTAFQNAQLGYANALSVLMIILGFVFSAITVLVSGFHKMESQIQ